MIMPSCCSFLAALISREALKVNLTGICSHRIGGGLINSQGWEARRKVQGSCLWIDRLTQTAMQSTQNFNINNGSIN